jgi:hypothetical protein
VSNSRLARRRDTAQRGDGDGRRLSAGLWTSTVDPPASAARALPLRHLRPRWRISPQITESDFKVWKLKSSKPLISYLQNPSSLVMPRTLIFFFFCELGLEIPNYGFTARLIVDAFTFFVEIWRERDIAALFMHILEGWTIGIVSYLTFALNHVMTKYIILILVNLNLKILNFLPNYIRSYRLYMDHIQLYMRKKIVLAYPFQNPRYTWY